MQAEKIAVSSPGIETFCASPSLVQMIEESDIAYREITLPPGQYVYRQSETGEHIYVVKNGYVEILALLDAGQETIIDILGAGALCGEGAAFDGAPRETSARTLVQTCVLRFSAAEFKRSIGGNANLTMSLLDAISVKQRMLLRRLAEVTQLPPEKRVLKLLAQISANSVDGSVSISHEKLARLIGLTRVTVTRAMGRLQKRGHLVRRDGRIFLASGTGPV